MNDFTEIEDMYILGLILEENHDETNRQNGDFKSSEINDDLFARAELESYKKDEAKVDACFVNTNSGLKTRCVKQTSREEKFSASFSEIRQQIESSRRKELKEVAKYILHHDYLLRAFLDRYIEMILEKRQIDIIH